MKYSVLAMVASVLVVSASGSSYSADTRKSNALKESIKKLPPYLFFYEPKFKADAYIGVAEQLQDVGKDEAVRIMRVVAEEPGCEEDVVIALIRMLFTAKAKSDFRRPFIGAPRCLGGTDYKAWPLEPIEMVEGVPFAIVTAYELGGQPEPITKYLDYCVRECDWITIKYRPKSMAEKKQALNRLLSSPKWKRPLTDVERRFLTAQISDSK